MNSSRRNFLAKLGSGTVAAMASPVFLNAQSRPRIAPSDQVNIAVVGVRNIGWANLRSHLQIPGVNCVALCDVDQRELDKRVSDVEKMAGNRPDTYTDFRKLYEHPDLDAVILGTPDHWHAVQTIQACEAGLDVYVEKPLANSIEECQVMAKAVKKHNRIVQVGQQQRSSDHWQPAMKLIRDGKIGRVNFVRAWNHSGPERIVQPVSNQAAPSEVDYKMWLGPAPDRPFNENRFHGSFRWYWDYAGGKMTDWGVHLIDMVLLGMDATAPNSVMASGGKFADPGSDMETPDTMSAIYEFDDFVMVWEHNMINRNGPYGKDHGIEFVGEQGRMIIDRRGWEITPVTERTEDGNSRYVMEKMPYQPRRGNPRDAHAVDFINSIKTREQPICPIEIGSHVAVVAHLGNISYRLGRKVYWDSDAYAFRDDDAAQKMVQAQYHNGWKLSV
ncbi:Gfo/Idh/MocA family protein [Tunicatimonas pelagia]|uniref:Gfo/Idh/MocA family protein n=1 Tax=Tunicatimonas pelagia TaxID=931531 RepID=UPI002665D07D|nr:Gfo/Idh/MocA family oxidoreductase [Tunicatimonas pelagia]WKN41093.1 Gfo/Idh/MocA family oxidoreductase [Tunicatimonas pelagia]